MGDDLSVFRGGSAFSLSVRCLSARALLSLRSTLVEGLPQEQCSFVFGRPQCLCRRQHILALCQMFAYRRTSLSPLYICRKSEGGAVAVCLRTMSFNDFIAYA